MSTIEIGHGDIISLDAWKRGIKDKSYLNTYRDYLELLSTDEIQLESKFLVELLEKSPLEIYILKKSKLLLKEVKSRTKTLSPERAWNIAQMINNVTAFEAT